MDRATGACRARHAVVYEPLGTSIAFSIIRSTFVLGRPTRRSREAPSVFGQLSSARASAPPSAFAPLRLHRGCNRGLATTLKSHSLDVPEAARTLAPPDEFGDVRTRSAL